MAKQRSKKGRLHQVHRWLQDRFPTPYETTLQIGSFKDFAGDCDRKGRKFVIRVSSQPVMEIMIDYLMHEYAHAMVWPLAKQEMREPDHPDDWGEAFAKLYRTYRDLGGELESDLY